MLDILEQLAPHVFMGGDVTDYEVVLDKSGGFLTRHLASGKVLPYVKSGSFLSLDALGSGIPGRGLPGGGMAQFAHPVLAAVNLGVAVANLGVSIWTAVKVYRMDKKLDEISGSLSVVDQKIDHVASFLDMSVSQIKGMFVQQSQLFGILQDQNRDLRHDIADLGRDVDQGFDTVQARITSETARREAEELEQK